MADRTRNTDTSDVELEAALEAIRLTQEYAQLPCEPGWTWWDFYRRHRPEDAKRLRTEWLHRTESTFVVGPITCTCPDAADECEAHAHLIGGAP